MTRIGSRHRAIAALTLAAATLLAGCGGTTVTTILGTVGGGLQVVAANLAFSTTTLAVPSGEPFSLALVNDDSAPHNLAIYGDASASDKLFGGEVVGGGQTRVYDVPALPTGTWFFRCDVHPDMHGTVVAARTTSQPSPARP